MDPGKREEQRKRWRMQSRLMVGRNGLQILFGVECVEEVALQAMLQQHPSRVAG